MSQTFSTLQRDVASGRVFSSRQGRVTVLPTGSKVPAHLLPQPPAAQPVAAPSPSLQTPSLQTPSLQAPFVPAPTAVRGYRFALAAQGLSAAAQVGQNGYGTVTVLPVPGGSYGVSASLAGVRPLNDPAVLPTLWLIHDLTVPADLNPADLASLPKGPDGTGNHPGSTFTLDGTRPTYGSQSNTLSICISPGSFSVQPDGTWQLSSIVDQQTNQSFHPLFLLGPAALSDMNASLPSGMVAEILTDLFMRTATVHPELSPRSHLPQRLAAVTARVLAGGRPHFIDGSFFTRAAVTIEGPVRTTPRLMPTRQTCCLAAHEPMPV